MVRTLAAGVGLLLLLAAKFLSHAEGLLRASSNIAFSQAANIPNAANAKSARQHRPKNKRLCFHPHSSKNNFTCYPRVFSNLYSPLTTDYEPLHLPKL
jgi:hypothetical protein